MSQDPEFDVDKAHRYFAADCFNKAWELIEKTDRTPEEDERMLCLSQASLWHWTKRHDCTDTNLAIGYWQLSRIHALLGRAEEARRYGQMSLLQSPQEKPFLRAYAYEALARAEKLAGNEKLLSEYREKAERLSAMVENTESRKLLVADLNTI